MQSALFRIADSIDVPFLTFNFWVSVWMLFYLFMAGFFDLNRIITYATRFTDEVFAFLIVSIFVLDALYDPLSDNGLFHYLNSAHKSHEDFEEDVDYNYMATGLLSVLLGLATTATAFLFRSFRHSAYFYFEGVRASLFDFAVILSVLLYTCIKHFIFPSIETETLNVPDNFGTTFECCNDSCTTFFPDDCEEQAASVGSRPWMVDPFDLNGKSWVPFMAAGPAILSFFLIFLDNGITWHIINHKSHNLKNGDSYNYDTVLSGFFNFVNSLFGLPWLVATTVPCIIHLHALADKDKEGKFRSVQETRLTGFFAHLIMALSMLALQLLKLIPLPVLYGVFLFMGLAALGGIQFWARILMFLQQPSKYNTSVPFIQYMKPKRIHMYTVIQIMFFVGVFAVQNIKAISIAFPFMTLMCIPGRLFLLPRLFEKWELTLLDGNEEDIKDLVERGELEGGGDGKKMEDGPGHTDIQVIDLGDSSNASNSGRAVNEYSDGV